MALLIAATPNAHAQYSISGEVWENGTTTNVPVAGSSIYSTTPTATFTLTNTSATALLDFDSANDDGLTSFLTHAYPGGGSNGDTLTYLSGSGAANDSIDNDLFEFQGTTTLANDTIYTFEHDDGLLLYLGGTSAGDLVINAGGPTSAATTDLCVDVPTTQAGYAADCTGGSNVAIGSQAAGESFTLDYAEVDGPPAVLATTLPLTGPPPSATPEPSSMMMLGTGLLAAAGMIRRRILA